MPKTKPHIFVLLALLILSGVIVSPCSAYYNKMEIQASDSNLNITKHQFNQVTSVNFGNETDVVSTIEMKYNIGTTVNFTLHYGDGNTVSGYAVFSSVAPLLWSRRTINLDSDTASQDFFDPGQLAQDREIISYASNMTDAGAMISQGFMIHNPATFGGQNILSYYPVSGGFAGNLITSVEITSDKPINVLILADTPENTLNNADFTSVSLLDNGIQWVNFALGMVATLLGFVTGLLIWLKFLFVDNLLLVISLYLSVSMAYSALTSRNIFMFYKRFFGFQRSMYDFMLTLWRGLVEIISSFRGIFRI